MRALTDLLGRTGSAKLSMVVNVRSSSFLWPNQHCRQTVFFIDAKVTTKVLNYLHAEYLFMLSLFLPFFSK